MKYFLRILAFLFISFSYSFAYYYDFTHDLQDATNYFNDLKNNVPKIVPVTNFISEGPFDFSNSGVDLNKYIGGSSSNTIVRPICNGCYLMREPHRLDGYMIIGSSYISRYIEFYPSNNVPSDEEIENYDDYIAKYSIFFYNSAPKNSTYSLVKIVTNSSNGTVYLVETNYVPGRTYGYLTNPSSYVLDSFDALSFNEDPSLTVYPDSFKSKKSLCNPDREYIAGLCVLKGYDVPCLDENKYFSEKLGKCVPACPEGSYYNSFSEECTSACDNVSNREERFDCLCKERGFGGYKSSIVSRELVITNTPNGAFSGDLYTGSIYCSTGELNSGDVSDYLKNKGYDDKDLEQSTSDFFEINDVIDKDNSSDSGSSDGSGDGSGGEQGSTEPMTPEQQQQEQDRNECKAIVAAITADFSNYTQKYVNNGIDCSDSNAVQLARDAKSTIEMKVQTYNQSKCATAYHRINVTVPVHSCKTDPTKPDPIEPPAPQNPSDTIKYDENTNTVTITDSAGNTQAVTPTDVTKNDKDELQTIKYTDPETCKTIEYKAKEDGTWERVEYPGQGTCTGTNPSDKEPGTGQGEGKPGGSSDGEGAGTSEDGKDDGNKDGEGNFEGGEFGALGNANDFDKGGELAGLYDSLSEKESENNGILDSIISDGFGLVNDIKQSIDNIKETAEDLKNNPFSSSSVTSCAIDLNILETSSQIDLCKYTSQFKALFSSIFFVFLNIVVGFAFFKILILLLINI